MTLQTNLATRPFYNVRAVQVLLGVLGTIVLVVTAYNVVRLVALTRAQQTLGAHAVESEREKTRLLAEAAGIRAKINPQELDTVARAAREANAIIDQRAFSWTALLAQFETTLPADVRITSIQPRQEKDGRIVVAVAVQARKVEDLDALLEALETQGTFRNVLAVSEQTTTEGLLEAVVEGTYTLPAAPQGQDAAPAAAGSPGPEVAR